jgi:hypothetical protein
VLLAIIDRYRAQGHTVVVRADAAFALPALYEALERRGESYAIRLRPMTSLSGPSRTCSPAPAADRATPRWSAIAASRIRRLPGTGHGG